MQIQWLGLSSFRIQTKQSVLVTDPYSDKYGPSFPKLKADITVVSNPENDMLNNVKRLSGDPFVIDGPGEYEIQETFVYGIPASTTVYLIEDEGIRVAFLGALESDLVEKQLEMIEGSDILLLPVGTLSKSQRTTIVSQVEPRMIIPYMYKQPKLKAKLEDVSVWLKEMGSKDNSPIDKLKIKKSELPLEETVITLLKPGA